MKHYPRITPEMGEQARAKLIQLASNADADGATRTVLEDAVAAVQQGFEGAADYFTWASASEAMLRDFQRAAFERGALWMYEQLTQGGENGPDPEN